MSQENVDVVRRAIDAYNRRDLDAGSRYLDPHVKHPVRTSPPVLLA